MGTILTTTNGGTNWIQRTDGNNQDIFKVSFTDQITGWIVCYDSLRRTYDGGVSWTGQAFTYVNAYDIYFANSSIGWTAGANGVITKTTNSGVNWTYYKYTSASNFTSMFFINPNTGWAVGTSGLIRNTTNGTDWILQTDPSPNYHFASVFFTDAANGWIVGSVGHIIHTTNGGANWSSQTTPPFFDNLQSVYFPNLSTGWIAGFNGRVLKTTNAGINWLSQSAGVTVQLNSVFFSDPNTGWIVGSDGTILKTTTGGTTFINQISSEVPGGFSLSQNYPNPFNPTTNLEFEIPELGFASLKIYNMVGEEVATLVNTNLTPGTYRYIFDASSFTSGIYYYTLNANSFSLTKKMLLVK